MKATRASDSQNIAIARARLNNRHIEYELFRAILSDDIHLKEPEIAGVKQSTERSNSATQSQESAKHTEPAATQDDESPATNNYTDVPSTPQFTGELLDVAIDDYVSIHELYLVNGPEVPEDEQTHVVIIHGYMAAIGFFIKNIESILKSKRGIRLHLIDLPGFGNSSRPKFPQHFLTDPATVPQKITQILEIENWFIDRLELWRKKRHIRHFKLIAHSMGAYLSSCYLMKYNKDNLVLEFMLVSPMGTESSDVSLLNNKKFQFNHHEVGGDPFQELHFQDENDNLLINKDIEKLWQRLGRPRFPKNLVLKKIWQYHKSPFQIAQYFGPLYSKILSVWSFLRFKNVKTNEDEEIIGTSIKPGSSSAISSTDLILKLHNYSYSIFNQYQGSGELAITKFINHRILPRLPLCDRGFIDYLSKSKVRTLWLYGDRDWMNHKGGEYIWEQLNELDPNLSDYQIIQNAGHHIYLDNPVEFNELAIKFFDLK
ncbi:alpha/beta-hydrolase [Suhomyces tanzawaensis NRRL Y-17324]|uniref:Alpha/beta-hydrolase n=1 Tax=Suhomyces tanzawaensis NRRL Y-17324 TaxID=984487 RepID=A0A1E4SS46_9ASCO|nr:alpha/beta-hydrolase [Suhomyces tanzawaensis NRRL Y-17324]ODV82336.1 alpha/beta-hydrolase [Suhomyces tanzawaensis NRRL Y-17324]